MCVDLSPPSLTGFFLNENEAFKPGMLKILAKASSMYCFDNFWVQLHVLRSLVNIFRKVNANSKFQWFAHNSSSGISVHRTWKCMGFRLYN